MIVVLLVGLISVVCTLSGIETGSYLNIWLGGLNAGAAVIYALR